jgi:hypothetical protein
MAATQAKWTAALAVAAIFMSGCDSGPPPKRGASAGGGSAPPTVTAEVDEKAEIDTDALGPLDPKLAGVAAAPKAKLEEAGKAGGQPFAAPGTAGDTEKAQEGVGKLGRGYGEGFVTTPVASYFSTKENIAFQIQIPKAMELYKAEHEHHPKTQKEFMVEIIDKNSIKLPELKEGDLYSYNPETAELEVVHTQQKTSE